MAVWCIALFALGGCGRSGNETDALVEPELKTEAAASESRAQANQSMTNEQAEDALQEVETVSREAAETAKRALDEAQRQAEELIAEVRALVSSEKWEEALEKVKALGSLELTTEQQEMVDNLKAKIQKAMQSKALNQGKKALGDLLRGEEGQPTND